MSNTPVEHGRVSTVYDSYQSKEMDQNGQPKTKYKYANIGRYTKWSDGSISVEIHSLPLGAGAPLKASLYPDDNNQQQIPQQGGQAQQPQQNYQQPAQNTYGEQSNGF